MQGDSPHKAAVSCSEMARMVSLSRQRFYQLIQAGTFPPPLYDVSTKRPFYDQELQHTCLNVRQRNMGINGKAIMFYARGNAIKPPRPRHLGKSVNKSQHADLIEGLKSLGLAATSAAQVESAIRELFPGGTAQVEQGEVLRTVFVRLKRKESGG